MPAMSNYLQNKFIDAMFRGTVYTPPTTLYIALVTVASTPAALGTEATYTGYARATVASNAANWASTVSGTPGAATSAGGTLGATSNTNVITIGGPNTGGTNSVVGFAIMDAITGGNELFYTALTNNKTINSGDPAPTFPASALGFSIA